MTPRILKPSPRGILFGGAVTSLSAFAAGSLFAATARSQTMPLFAYVGCRATKERNAHGEGIGVFRVDGRDERMVARSTRQ